MHPKNSLLIVILLAIALLTACNLPQNTFDQAVDTSTPVPLSPTAKPTLTPPPSATQTSPPPTHTPEDTLTPIATLTPPSITAGATLERFATSVEPVFTRLQMFDPRSGWGIGGLQGSSDHIFTTLDGGTGWHDVTPPQPGDPGSLEATAFFMNATTAWVTFSSLDTMLPTWPVVWQTHDSGRSWQSSQLLDLSDLSQAYSTELTFADMQHGWLLTHVGVGMSHDYVTLFRTTDGGLTWERLLDPYTDGQIQICQKTGMLFLDSQVGWLTGDCGGVMAGVFLTRTEDGGVTWTYIDLPAPSDNAQLYDVNAWAACGGYDLYFFDPTTAVMGVRCTLYDQSSPEPTLAHYLYTTADGGASWSSLPYPGGVLLFTTPQIGWALSKDIYQTSDGGATWSLANHVTWDASFNFISPQLGWAAAYNDTEYALVGTSDGGANWFMLTPVIAP